MKFFEKIYTLFKKRKGKICDLVRRVDSFKILNENIMLTLRVKILTTANISSKGLG